MLFELQFEIDSLVLSMYSVPLVTTPRWSRSAVGPCEGGLKVQSSDWRGPTISQASRTIKLQFHYQSRNLELEEM
jgi:hypothetical protein